MRSILILSLFFYANFSFAQNPINEQHIGLPEGENSDYYINGATRCTYTILDSNLQGVRTCRYRTGELWAHEEYDKGMYHGTNYSPEINGDTSYIEIYQHDSLLYSKNFWYYKSGQKKQETMIWYAMDSTMRQDKFKHRKIFNAIRFDLEETQFSVNNIGVGILYYKSGNVEAVIEIQNGRYNGLYTEYYPSGEVKIIAEYKDDKRHGEEIGYDKQGNIEYKDEYLNDKRVKK